MKGAKLVIYSRDAAKTDMNLTFKEGEGKMILQFIVDDIQMAYEKIKMLNVTIINKPTTYPWGACSMQFKDPDGNLITFASLLKQS